MNSGKYSDAYYDHVLGKKKATGAIAKVFDIINDMSGRCGIGDEFDQIDGEIQDEIIDGWIQIIERNDE